MTVRSLVGDLRRKVLCAMHTRPVPVESRIPVVSFCFDDFPRTAYTAGGNILNCYGARGTYYAALGLINTKNELGDQMRHADIDSLLADGHELGSHTFFHSSCRRIPFDAFEKDVHDGEDAIRSITGCTEPSFAYPFGHVTIASKRRLGAKLSSSRGIFGGINGPQADLNLLLANSLYGELSNFTAAESLLIANEKARGWLIFYTHDVRKAPSAFGCSPALLDRVVTSAIDKGFRIAPVGEVVAERQLQFGQG